MQSVNNLLNNLNEKQKEAVTCSKGNYLILAGAGSGKTKVLVHRISWLIKNQLVKSSSVMAVTFTNKASNELNIRVGSLLSESRLNIFSGTFHGLCHRLLRIHAKEACLDPNFQIIDADDQLRLLKKVIKGMNLDEKKWSAKEAAWFINGQKDDGIRPSHTNLDLSYYDSKWMDIYKEYQNVCERSSLVDFSELLLRTHELLNKNETLKDHYQRRFEYIFVDEFQDTSKLQYKWLKSFYSGRNSVMIVGDDDQSIYGWRGANIDNINMFLKDFYEVETIKLEQNYRSTSHILNAANRLIKNNNKRLGKNLWTEMDDGEKISIYSAINDIDEAIFVVEKIQHYMSLNTRPKDIAILYRSNMQSRLFEDQLSQVKIPYYIYGGTRFFDRMEIKDCIAYLRILQNKDDDASIERVLNRPTRGIGLKTIESIRLASQVNKTSMWSTMIEFLDNSEISSRTKGVIERFLQLITAMSEEASALSLTNKLKLIIQNTGLKNMYLSDKSDKSGMRVENIEELVNAAKQFEASHENENMNVTNEFLSYVSLESGEEKTKASDDVIQMMTLHSSKGLEFKVVFLVGVEEGLFPSPRSLNEKLLEEERRLAYVGITRAMDKLFLSHAETRRIYGKEQYHLPSRFIDEIPEHCIENGVNKMDSSNNLVIDVGHQTKKFMIGDRIEHPKFGKGYVLNLHGNDDLEKIEINFDFLGRKWLILSLCNIKKI